MIPRREMIRPRSRRYRAASRQAPGLLLAILAGCATVPPPPPAGPAFDGVYAGSTTLLRGIGFQCGIPDLPQKITVRGGRFDYPFQVSAPTTVPIHVQIAADGSFNTSIQYGLFESTPWRPYRTAWATVAGRIVDDMMDVTEVDLRCARRSLLRRTPP